ncbi:MAG: glycosyltransferase family 4 protein [Geminicoccaceae bacterium]
MSGDAPIAPDILIANGFDRYHLLTAAVEAERRGRLERCIAGFYPTERLGRLARLGLDRQQKFRRLMDRKVDLPDERLVTMPIIETAGHLGGRLLGERAICRARKRFAGNARRVVENSRAALYHYRTGFGHGSAAAARRQGMATLADHSIAHPGVLAHLVQNRGRLPAAGEQGSVTASWRDVMDDLRHTDRVLVNSDFVRETFVHQGWDPARIDVIYQGLDESFLDLLESIEQTPGAADGTLSLVFAGAFEQRKGADHLAEALTGLGDVPWKLQLVGPIDEAMRTRHAGFLADPRVDVAGRVGRGELAARLKAADVFLFPSLAEGSARVVFEALAAGCFVVTTRNSGSIVQDDVHGFLVKPDGPETTRDALRRAHADRDMTRKIGDANRAVVRDHHRQSGYGDALMAVYDRLLAGQRPDGRQEAA